MKINFQYFAIKYIACAVGYTSEEAQFIASTSQFISDNYQDASVYTDYNSLSDGIKDNHLYTGSGKKCKVPLILTALESLDDLKALSDKVIQENRLIPFDYFPKEQIDNNLDYDVKPIKELDDNEIFEAFFKSAKKLYNTQDDSRFKEDSISQHQKNALVRLGILMHILANTFTHEPFNGYENNKNALTLEEAIDSVTYQNITNSYNPEEYKAYPNVGSVRLGGVDSDYNVQFFAKNTKDSRKKVIRVNDPIFMDAGQAVYNFLMIFKNKKPSQQEWDYTIKPNLEKGLSSNATTIDDLIKCWSDETPFEYYYDPEVCKASLVKLDKDVEPDDQGYFDFLVTVDQIRKSVIYDGGIMMKAYDCATTVVSCEVESPVFNGTDFTINANMKINNKLDSISAEVTVLDSATGTQLLTNVQIFRNTSRFNMEFQLPIPMNDSGYEIHYDFSWKEKGMGKKSSYSDNVDIKGNNNIITNKDLIHPSSNSNDYVQVINGTESGIGDYRYPLNDYYTDQEGIELLDLYLPVEFKLKLAENFKIFRMRTCSIALKGLDDDIKYCNNEKYIEEKVSKDTGELYLKYTDEWKNHIQTKPFTRHKASLVFELDVELEVISSDEDGFRTITLKNADGNSITKTIVYLWGLR